MTGPLSQGARVEPARRHHAFGARWRRVAAAIRRRVTPPRRWDRVAGGIREHATRLLPRPPLGAARPALHRRAGPWRPSRFAARPASLVPRVGNGRQLAPGGTPAVPITPAGPLTRRWGRMDRLSTTTRETPSGERPRPLPIRGESGDGDRRVATPPAPPTEPGSGTAVERLERRMLARLERSSPLILEQRTKDLLARVLKLRIPPVTLYSNRDADDLLRRRGADALTYRDTVVVRGRTYNPAKPAGLALLGHELTHAARLAAQRHQRVERRVDSNPDAEERAALENERSVLRSFGVRPADRQPSVPAPVSVPALPRTDGRGQHTALVEARAALSSRDLGMLPETMSVATARLPEEPITQLKAEIYRDLLDRLRIEFERGG